MQNGIFRDANCGFYSVDVDSTLCSNLLSNNISSEENAGIFFYQVGTGEIIKNIVLNSSNGIIVKDYTNPDVYNNYCLNNEFGFQFYISNSEIFNNTIENCETGFRICGPASPNVYLNNTFDTEIGFLIGYSGYYPSATPEIHNNNINSNTYFFKVLFTSETNINAENNYYYTNDLTEINNKIYDKDDYPLESQYRVGIVYFEPILNENVQDAGVQQ